MSETESPPLGALLTALWQQEGMPELWALQEPVPSAIATRTMERVLSL